MKAWGWWGAGFGMVGAVAGCTLIAGVENLTLQEAGVDARSGGGFDAGAQDAVAATCAFADGSAPTVSQSCNACLQTYCCAAAVATLGSTAGASFVQCIAECSAVDGGAACEEACIQGNASGHQVAAPYVGCRNYNCNGGVCPPLGAATACTTCLTSSAGGYYKDCASDPACDARFWCLDNCVLDGGNCVNTCAAYDGGTAFLRIEQNFNLCTCGG